MYALQAGRGNEIEDSILYEPQSLVYDKAENRLYTAKAVIILTTGEKYIESSLLFKKTFICLNSKYSNSKYKFYFQN
ncbi:hypothetical protein [Clostridium sp. Marseille-Q7071]